VTDLLYHLPLALIVFVIILLGATDLAIGVERPVLATLLAPTLWVGLYFLGSHRATRKES